VLGGKLATDKGSSGRPNIAVTRMVLLLCAARTVGEPADPDIASRRTSVHPVAPSAAKVNSAERMGASTSS
jgi:hypothetical protein